MAMDKVLYLTTTRQGISDVPEPVGAAGVCEPTHPDRQEVQAAGPGKDTGIPIRSIAMKTKAVGFLKQQISRSNSVSTSDEKQKRKRGDIIPHKEEIYKKKENPLAFVILFVFYKD